MKTVMLAPCAPCLHALALTLVLLSAKPASAQNAQADLWQARNGTPAAPRSPVEWVRGNAGSANSHYVEGYSVPYRLVISGLSTGAHQVVIEWDTEQMGKHALDFLSHYDRLVPHNQFGAHTEPETVQPLDGLAGPFAAPRTFPLPTPSSGDDTIATQPTRSFLELPPEQRTLTIWNGRILGASYLLEEPLGAESASSRLAIQFEAEPGTVVLAWGGHLASKLDWGAGGSASQINGASYHMRVIALDGSGGNQDRSLQAIAVVSPPICVINGPESSCPGVTDTHAATSDAGAAVSFAWTLTTNSAGAFLVGPTNQASVDVVATAPGSFTLLALAFVGTAQSTCTRLVTVLEPVVVAPLVGQTVCRGQSVTLTANASGSGPLTYRWRKDDEVVPEATGPILVLQNITAADAGSYCVEVTGPCGSGTSCAMIAVHPLPLLACAEEILRSCVTALPPADPATVLVLTGAAPVVVAHGGDITNREDGDVVVTRLYLATDACGQVASCMQRLVARDRTAPELARPRDLVRPEAPAGSGQATVTYPEPAATDTCDPAVECAPPAGSSFPVGDTVVRCVARDAAGNSTVVAFEVRVVPRTITVTSLADAGPATLRQAMLDANGAAGSNTIAFAFAGSAPHTVHLLSPLPAISDALFIDGWSQLTFTGAPVVELDGGTLESTAPSAENPGPAAPPPAGLVLASGGNVVRGLVLNGFGVGLRLEGPGGNFIAGNFIGPDSTGTNPIGNTLDGILLTGGTSGNIIGPGNLIAFNGGNGVSLDPTAGSGNAIFDNRIVFNGGLPIDLGADGTTPNDANDPDSGPNDLQNSPILERVQSDGFTSTTVHGMLLGQPQTTYALEFTLELPTTGADPRQAQVTLGSGTVTTDAEGSGRFAITLPVGTRSGQFLTATASDPRRSTSEQAARVPVQTPPIILEQPEGVTLPLGASSAVCVTATGTEPLFYQWRRNGANILGATNACLVITEASLADGGSYTVVVANELDAISSEVALVVLALPEVPFGDAFAGRLPLVRPAGVTTGTNSAATREPGEPAHAGKAGAHSVWYSWIAPADGIATFATTGSTFDTLLGVYLGNSLTNLEALADDEDRGGYFTSQARFNAVAGLEYQVAIDGFGGASGHFVLRWELEVTTQQLAIITNQPVSQTVLPGGSATFVVGAAAGCRDGHHDCRHPDKDHHEQHPEDIVPVYYQWYLNNTPLAGATNATFTLANAGEMDLGNYTVRVREGSNTVESVPASLQLNLTGPGFIPLQTADKFLDAANAAVQLRLGTPGSISPASLDPAGGFQPAALVRGYTGTQVFNTFGSLTEGEIVCGVIGGASEWLSFVAEENGTLFLNTDGSSFDTVLAFYRRSPTNAARLELVNCDNNSGTDHRDSALQVPVLAGHTNFIVIDGVNGATGTLRLNYALVTPAALSLSLPGLNTPQAGKVRVSGHAAMRFTLEASSNLVSWVPVLTTNSASAAFEFTDPASANAPRRYYRAVMLP